MEGANTGRPVIYVLNGPNLNLLGVREPEIYGHETIAELEALCRREGAAHGMDIQFFQSNREYELIDWIQQARATAGGIVINAAAFTHTSIAIHDALAACSCPIVEVHISNIHKREAFRRRSYVSLVADGVIAGCGVQGYALALQRLAVLLRPGA